jgi:hypothetical protein
LIGVRTCASVSALSFEAQPAELDSEVRRICFPSGIFLLMGIIILDFVLVVSEILLEDTVKLASNGLDIG